jgi:D-inositol-3-phosphate glycosyltransferase
MAGIVERVAMVSMHSSPVAQPGTADAGGMNVTILGVAAELAIRGVTVDLLTRASGPPGVSQLLPGVTLHELAAGEAGPLPKDRLSEVADEFGEAVAALARREAAGFDIVHAHYWLSGIATLPVAIELGVPLVQSFHTLAAMKDASGTGTTEPIIRRRSETFLATQADAIVAVSSAEATALIDAVGAPADRTWIIPPGVDLDLFRPRAETGIRRALDVELERPIVALAGRMQPLKGHELAVRALAEVHALRGWAPLLVIAGEVTPGDEAFLEGLRSLAGELGVASDIRFVGALHRDALAELLAEATVTLVPSFSETFGLVALESAAAGTPVIGFRAGGLAESVGEAGVLLDTRDPRVWAREIALMIDGRQRRSALGLSARAHAEHYTWGAAATSLLGVYAGIAR